MPHPHTLYKRTTTGAVQQWSQEIQGNRYRTLSGQVGGKIVVSEWTVCQGKNAGRANATSPEEQAVREVAANYTKKQKEGYHDTVEAIDTPRQGVMLAKDYKDYGEKVFRGVFRPYSQPKLDGWLSMPKPPHHQVWLSMRESPPPTKKPISTGSWRASPSMPSATNSTLWMPSRKSVPVSMDIGKV